MDAAGCKRTVQTVKYSPTKGRAISWTTASCGRAHRSAHCRRNVGMCRPTEEHQLISTRSSQVRDTHIGEASQPSRGTIGPVSIAKLDHLVFLISQVGIP
jgi:hypothetical protein